MNAVAGVASALGVALTCAAFGLPRATYYRRRKAASGPSVGALPPSPSTVAETPKPANPLIAGTGSEPDPVVKTAPEANAAVVSAPTLVKPSPRALSADERRCVLDVLHDPRFVDLPPAEIVATLLDEGTYHCSERTMYRILAAHGEVRERRDQLRHPKYAAPELLATRPNQVWSWDITKLRTTVKWSYFYLYVILDVFSRYVVGWMVAEEESTALAQRLVAETCEHQRIDKGQLTLHHDRGSPMTALTMAQLLANLGVADSRSRPHVSNDNPFSESQFKTLKYRPDFPDRLDTMPAWRAYLVPFFHWYNDEHRHAGIALLTPRDVHVGQAEQRLAARAGVLAAAHAAHPERFVRGAPRLPTLPAAVGINQPKVQPVAVVSTSPGTMTKTDALLTLTP